MARKAKARFYDFTSLHPAQKLVRLAELEEGAPIEMELQVSARPDYVRRRAVWRDLGAGGFAIDETALFTNLPLHREGDDLAARAVVAPRVPLWLVFDYSEEPAPRGGRKFFAGSRRRRPSGTSGISSIITVVRIGD